MNKTGVVRAIRIWHAEGAQSVIGVRPGLATVGVWLWIDQRAGEQNGNKFKKMCGLHGVIDYWLGDLLGNDRASLD